jgi:hypothetical protein
MEAQSAEARATASITLDSLAAQAVGRTSRSVHEPCRDMRLHRLLCVPRRALLPARWKPAARMSSRHGQPGARPTPSRASMAASIAGSQTAARRREAEEQLPPYKRPCHPLNDRAQAKLRALNDRSAAQLKEHNQRAGDRITEAAALVLDTLHERHEAVAKQRTRWAKGIDTQSREPDEARLAELQALVDTCSKKLEESMRAIVDNGVAAQRIEDSLVWLQTHAPGRLQQEYATQISHQQSQRASQLQRRPTRNTDDDDNDNDNGNNDVQDEQDTQASVGPTPGPTPLDGSRPSLTGVSDMYADRVERQKNDYTSISYVGRYARNGAYSNFKKMVHDARYRDDRPLPDPETWFTETGSPAPGVTGHGEDHDGDDDIVMERATISVKCPLTFLPYKDPYTSLKCPHTFEKAAIMEMIRKSTLRAGAGSAANGEKAVKCPVTGCDQVRSESSLISLAAMLASSWIPKLT